MRMIVAGLALAMILVPDSALAMEGYYRSPTLRGDVVVFTAEGDLWTHNLSSGQTLRLTTHPALETNAALSPDGQQLAFVADYEGVPEVYVMPVTGGVPRRISYENDSVVVQGWSSSGLVIYAAASDISAPYSSRLRSVNPLTLEVVTAPLADANDGVLDPTERTLYFSQKGSRWDSTTQYRGGRLGTLWSYEMGSNKEATRLLREHPGSIHNPMIDGNTLYFLSDASGRQNLWSMDLASGQAAAVTNYQDYSVREASIDAGRAIYRRGADLFLRDLDSQASTRLELRLSSDHPALREAWDNAPLDYLTDTRLSGDGSKVALTARGQIALATTDQRRLVKVATPIDARMRHAALSRDGKWVYSVSDAAGELELWRYSALGDDTAQQLTDGSETLRGKFFESPDGQWIAHDDGDGSLKLLNVNTRKELTVVADAATSSPFTDVVWSGNSRYLALSYTKRDASRPRILLYSLEDQQRAFLSSDKYESREPAFSHDGHWLYYLSDRHFETTGSVWSDRDFGPAFLDRTQVFAHALTHDAVFPFQTPTELTPEPASNHAGPPENTEERAEDQSTEPPGDHTVELAWEGIETRIWQVPVDAGAYADLALNDSFLYLLNSSNEEGAEILVLPLKAETRAETLTDGATAMQLSDDGRHMLVVKHGAEAPQMHIVPAEGSFPEDLSLLTVKTQNWKINTDPKAEWAQLFHDAWMMHREQFYDPEMRGVDWVATRNKYEPLLQRITDRHELNDVLEQMMGELNALHSAVRGGDLPSDPDAPSPSTLGAQLTQSDSGVRIEHIYYHDPEVPSEAPPLSQPGVDAQSGDIILAINGRQTDTLEAVHRALRNQVGQQVLLQLRRGDEDLQTVAVPVEHRRDQAFRYLDWSQQNRVKVETAEADLGYVHIRRMGGDDVAAFAREFYAQQGKKGIVIDVRRNTGGNVDSWLIDRLIRKAWAFWAYRSDAPYTNMQNSFRGHLVVLADEFTYSDGETFAAAIKALDIAPVIGKRTAGAGVWLSGRNRLSDRGIARVAEFPVYAMDGRWLVEGYGVEPTMEVDNLPHATYLGDDAQLDAAIKYLQDKLAAEPIPGLIPQPFPDVRETAGDITR